MVNDALPTRDMLFEILNEVPDPEVPVLSVVELGIVRDAIADEAGVTVTVTPTYSGCPAMRVIEDDIRRALTERGFAPVVIKTTYAPVWTTDWITPEARAKLEAYGIAAPGARHDDELVPLRRHVAAIRCPYCKSQNTTRRSEFGSTACKAIWFCRNCAQPFEEFKAI